MYQISYSTEVGVSSNKEQLTKYRKKFLKAALLFSLFVVGFANIAQAQNIEIGPGKITGAVGGFAVADSI